LIQIASRISWLDWIVSLMTRSSGVRQVVLRHVAGGFPVLLILSIVALVGLISWWLPIGWLGIELLLLTMQLMIARKAVTTDQPRGG
jgi:hypothetical protein